MERRWRRARAGVLLAAVVLGSAGCGQAPSAPGTTAPTTAAPAAPVVRAGAATGDVLVQGTLSGIEPGADPANVRAVLWPQNDDTKVGEAVKLFETEPATVDTAGHWAIELDPASVSATFLAGSAKFVNFDVVVETGSTGAQWSTSAWRVDDGDVWRSEGATAADRVIDVSMDLDARQVTLTDSLGEATTSPLAIGTFGPPAD